MKHLKRKPIFATKLSDDVIQIIENAKDDNTLIEDVDYSNHYPFVITEGQEFIQAFQYKSNGENYIIPESNPIVIYFELARQYSKYTSKYKADILSQKTDAYNMLTKFYGFYSVASISGIFLFNSIEAFINKIIPNNYTYQKNSPKKTELFNKDQIQRGLSFDEKIKIVVPDFTNKYFHQEYAHKYETLKQLKIFRDEIMHTKSFEASDKNFYKALFTTSLDFDYEKALYAVRDFINYYEPNLIEECNCGKEE